MTENNINEVLTRIEIDKGKMSGLTAQELTELGIYVRKLQADNTALRDVTYKAIDDEPELPDDMVPAMWSALKAAVLADDKEMVQTAFRITVQLTKEGIRQRFDRNTLAEVNNETATD